MSNQTEEFNFLSILTFVYKWKWPLLISTLIAGIIAYVVSSPLVTDPLYSSESIFYPSSSGTISGSLLSDRSNARQSDILTFGEEEEAEQLLQILQSGSIKGHIKEKFNLMKRWEIDTNSAFPNYIFNQKYQSRINFEKTKYLSLRVRVLDEDPQVAADMANEIVRWMDSVKTRVVRKRAKQALKIVETRYEETEKFVQGMVDSLQSLGELGILNFEDQSGALSSAYSMAIINNSDKALEDVKKKLENLAKYGPVHKSMSERIILEMNNLSNIRQKYEQIKVDANETLPNAFIIDRAVPADKRAWPIIKVNVALSMLGTFILTLIILVFIENYRKVKQKLEANS